MVRIVLFVHFLFLSHFLNAQEKEQSIRFNFTFNGEAVKLNKTYYSEKIGDSVRLENIKLYISHPCFLLSEKVVDSINKKYHLVDLENPQSLFLNYSISNTVKFDALRFSIGIDSLTNVSGAMGGDLDPTMGMYWAWQSGYINFKLEGKSRLCPTRKNIFQFHLGGYQYPNATFQTLEFPLKNSNPIVVNIAIDELLKKIDIKSTNEIMSPGPKTKEILQMLSSVITVTQ